MTAALWTRRPRRTSSRSDAPRREARRPQAWFVPGPTASTFTSTMLRGVPCSASWVRARRRRSRPIASSADARSRSLPGTTRLRAFGVRRRSARPIRARTSAWSIPTTSGSIANRRVPRPSSDGSTSASPAASTISTRSSAAGCRASWPPTSFGSPAIRARVRSASVSRSWACNARDARWRPSPRSRSAR